jgi:hypothetical protein
MSDILDLYAETPSAEEMLKAYDNGTIQKLNKPKSAIIDPYSTQGIMGVRSKPSSIPYYTLRQMAQVPAISAIINTRLNQVARFARRPRFEGDMGFKLVLKDKEAKMNKAQKEQAFEIEEFFLTTGTVPNRKRKDNFDKFLRKIVRDTLTIDAMTWEHVGNRKGTLAEIWAVDPTTIELVADNPAGDGNTLPVYQPVTKRGLLDDGDISYVQKVDGQTIAEYTNEELCYAIRNPRTDIYTTDFGLSELETLIEIVTGIMNGVRYNTSYFSESHLPQGVLEIVGKYEDKHLEAFKRHWKTMTNGAGGKWAVPVMALSEGQGFKFTPFKQSNRDMEFNEFLEFLFNIACAVYQIDPNEVGFKSWTSQSGSMGQSDNTSVKIDQSKDKGFVPLMQFLANTFNTEIVDRIDDQYALMWIGVDDEDEKSKQERDKLNVDMGKITIAELRKRDDLEEILGDDGKPAPWTQAPANATLIQVYMAGMQAQQAEAQGDQAQAQTDQATMQGKLTADDAHNKQLEIMDKQHKQGLESKDMEHKQGLEKQANDHKHQQGLETMKQKSAKQSKPLKKSFDNEEDDIEVVIEWDAY